MWFEVIDKSVKYIKKYRSEIESTEYLLVKLFLGCCCCNVVILPLGCVARLVYSVAYN